MAGTAVGDDSRSPMQWRERRMQLPLEECAGWLRPTSLEVHVQDEEGYERRRRRKTRRRRRRVPPTALDRWNKWLAPRLARRLSPVYSRWR